jgi:phage shock protein C
MSGTGKVLRRSKQNRIIAGVCAGLGDFFGIDPVWFRLGFVLALLPGGIPGFLIYAICWIVIPGE